MEFSEDAINQMVWEKYPLYKGIYPKAASIGKGSFRLIYEAKSATPDGCVMKTFLRVTLDSEGNIRSISASK